MVTLVLGVIDVPYVSAPSKRKKRGESQPVTTGDVANILEANYGLFTAFYTAHKDKITGYLTNALAGAMETIQLGGPVPHDLYVSATQQIVEDFRMFLMTGEIESMGIAGVPTQASIDRRSGRFKSGRAKGPRPSFVDTGILESSFIAWLETQL